MEQFEQVQQLRSFQIFYNMRNINATWGLAALIILMFILEEYLGGSTNTAVLVNMGANVGVLVRHGEYSRLLTSVFLHAGYMHVLFNTYVLFALGSFFNKILGHYQYLTLFLISGFCGSLASIYVGNSQISVGASGAIWGLFGASIALAFFKTKLIPEILRLRLRRITMINLAINLGVSFLPMVDMWAHFGGGIAGFLLSLIMIYQSENKFLAKLKHMSFFVLAYLLIGIYLIAMIWTLLYNI